MKDNATRSRAVRELVAILFRGAGFGEARHRLPAARMSQRIAEADHSDIIGVPEWHLGVHADVQHRYGARVDEAERAAAQGGVRHAATIQFRREADADRYLVVMSLDGFLRLLQETRQEVAA